MTIEKIRTHQGAHPIKDYPFSRDGWAWRCVKCGEIWLKEKPARLHDCPGDPDEISPSS
jgi:hypothetical protein